MVIKDKIRWDIQSKEMNLVEDDVMAGYQEYRR